jgi:NAD(P)-dependent dehydrogenase (short-subunit alcohol dehydrogenase family)
MAGKDYEGFVVVVTGASSGLGRAIAEETAARGAAAVVINYASNTAEAGCNGGSCKSATVCWLKTAAPHSCGGLSSPR